MNFGATREHVSRRPARNAFGKMRVLAYSMVAIALPVALLATNPLPQSKAVIGGSVQSTAPSWTAVLGRVDANHRFKFCSGVLISENLLLSARHCQDNVDPDRAAIGTSDLYKPEGTDAAIKAYEGYSGDDDLAVYQLSSPVSNTYITLSSEDIHLTPQPVTLFGYGVSSEPTDPNPKWDFKLRSVGGMSVSCSSRVGYKGTPSEFCLESQTKGQSPCDADSGAPIVTSGTLGAIYSGSILSNALGTQDCVGSLWSAISVTTPPVRKWIADMIAKYHVHDGL